MWPFEIPTRRLKRSSPKTWYWRHRILFVAGPESWPKASSTSASSTASAVVYTVAKGRAGGRSRWSRIRPVRRCCAISQLSWESE